MSTPDKPVLWHIPVSHYSEKARWALDLKGIDHDRRAPLPGPHMLAALWLTRGRSPTFPVLDLDGRAIGNSSAIIAALERGFPDPPLYPADAGERRRALALEEFFDEELGPHARLLAFDLLRRDPERLQEFTAQLLPPALAGNDLVRRLAGEGSAAFVKVRYGVGAEEDAERARTKVLAAMDRLEREIDGGGGSYLVGDAFGVADLTAASMFLPLVTPPEGPDLPEAPPALEEFRGPLRERPGFRWLEGIFTRHRQGARRP